MPLKSLSQLKGGDSSESSSSSSGGLKSLQDIRFDSQQKSLIKNYPSMVDDESNYAIQGPPAPEPIQGPPAPISKGPTYSDFIKSIIPSKQDFINTLSPSNLKNTAKGIFDKIGRPSQVIAEYATPNAPLIGNLPNGGYGEIPGTNARQSFLDRTGQQPASGFGEKALGMLASPFVVPGAGLGTGSEISKVADLALERFAPKFATTLGGKALQGAAVGAPLGAGMEMATGTGDTKDVLMGAAFGAGLGAAVPVVGNAIGKLGKYAGTKIGDALSNFMERNKPNEISSSPTDSIPTEPIQPTSSPIASKLTPLNGTETLDRVMAKIKPIVTERMTPPLENPNELAKWVQGHFGEDISLNELRKLPYEDLRQLAEEMRGNLNVSAEATKAARELGHDLPSLLEGKNPNVSQKVSQNAAERVAGIYPNELPRVSKPQFNEKVPGNLETPSTPKQGPSANIEGVQGYAGNKLPFRQAATQTDRTINRNQVVNNMRKNLGVTIDTGRLVSPKKGTLGQFKVDPAVIRTRMAEDIQVISHEVGHNLDKRYNLKDPAYQQELVNLTNTVSPNHLGNYKPAQYHEEAIAEYFRIRLTDPQQAEQLAPNFTKFLESKLSPKDLKGLEASVKDVDTWISQGEYNQAKGLIDFTSGTKKEPFSYDKFYSRFVDDLNPLKLAEKALKGAVGIGKDSIYKMARLSRGISQRAELAVKRGIYENGKKVADGLADIVKPLEDIGMKEEDFATYMAVKHAHDLKYNHGKEVPFDDSQMNAVMQKWDQNPVVQKVHKQVMDYNHALLNILEEAQILAPNAIKDMKQKYPNYVPFMRYFDDDAVAGFKNGGFGAAKGFANITNPIKKMSEEGSTRTIINPIESMVKNTFLVMNAAAKNKVGLQLNELSKIQNAGAWVENVGKGSASQHAHEVSVFINGERHALKIRNPDLHSAMLSLDTESSNSLIRFLGGAASLLRAGATLTPDFMIRNAMRDIVGNTVNSTKYGFNPLTIVNGLYHMVNRKTGVFDQFLSNGGAMGTLMSLDRDANREALKAVFKTSLKDKTMNVITSPKELAKMLTGITPLQKTVGLLRKGSEISEISTRLGAFNKVLKKTGSPEEAAYEARDLMDFNRAGSAIRPANKAIAFMNASIQGTDRMARAFKENPASFLVRAGTTLVLPAASIYMWNKHLPEEDQKIYDNIPQWQKDSFFIVGVPGTGKFLRIPKPFEAGMLFATGTERVLQYMEKHDPEAFKGYASSVVQGLTPPMLMTALTPLLEAITNHSFFRNAPVIPQGEQGLERKDQYGLYTSETAKTIGNIVSKTPFKDSNMASPRIIDNTIKGYTAGLGQYAVNGLDSVIKSANGKNEIPQPAKSITEKAPISSFMATTSGGGQIRQDFYDKWDELSKAEASAKKNQQPYSDPQYFLMSQSKQAMDAMNKQYKIIQASPTMTPKEKRTQLDELDKFINEIAAQSLGKK